MPVRHEFQIVCTNPELRDGSLHAADVTDIFCQCFADGDGVVRQQDRIERIHLPGAAVGHLDKKHRRNTPLAAGGTACSEVIEPHVVEVVSAHLVIRVLSFWRIAAHFFASQKKI